MAEAAQAEAHKAALLAPAPLYRPLHPLLPPSTEVTISPQIVSILINMNEEGKRAFLMSMKEEHRKHYMFLMKVPEDPAKAVVDVTSPTPKREREASSTPSAATLALFSKTQKKTNDAAAGAKMHHAAHHALD